MSAEQGSPPPRAASPLLPRARDGWGWGPPLLGSLVLSGLAWAAGDLLLARKPLHLRSLPWLLLLGAELGGLAHLLARGAYTLARLLIPSYKSRQGWLGDLLLAVPAAFWLGFCALDLLDRPTLRGRSWSLGLRSLSLLVALLAALLLVKSGRALRQAPKEIRGPGPWKPALILSGKLVLLVGLALLALHLLPGSRALEQLLAGFFLVLASFGGAQAGRLLGTNPKGRAWMAGLALVTLLLGPTLLLAGGPPGPTTPLRRDLVNRAPLSSLFWRRVLSALSLPASVQPPGEELRRQAGDALSPPLLDRIFPGRQRWNLVLVTIDTLRADRLFARLSGGPLMPVLSDLAKTSTLFEAAYAQYPSSQLSLASLFTGRYPTTTEMLHLRYLGAAGKQDWKATLLSQCLKKAGFATAASTAFARPFLERAVWYLPWGFDRFEAAPAGDYLDGQVVVARARKLLDAFQGQRPFFLWVHLFDPHKPYRKHPGLSAVDPVRRYEGEVRYVDTCLGILLQALRRRPDWNRTLLAIHADHGEALGEHGTPTHNSSLYEEQVRVPLILRVPGTHPRQVARPVELLSLGPTLLELLNAPRLPRAQAPSLASLVLPQELFQAGRPSPPPPWAFTELRERHRIRGSLDALRAGSWKAILDRNTGLMELYDLSRDPGEQHDLALDRPRQSARMARLMAWFEGLAASQANRPVAWEPSRARPEIWPRRGGPPTPASQRKRRHALLAALQAGQDSRAFAALLRLARQEGAPWTEQLLLQLEWGTLSPAEALEALQILLDREPHAPALLLTLYEMPWPSGLATPRGRQLQERILALRPPPISLLRKALHGANPSWRTAAQAALGKLHRPGLEARLESNARLLGEALLRATNGAARLEALRQRITQAGLQDWGLIWDLSTWWDPCGAELVSKEPAGPARRLLQRLKLLLQSQSRPAKPTLVLVGHKPGLLARQAPLLLPLALRLDQGGGGLLGGRGPGRPRLSLVAAGPGSQALPLLERPLPRLGLLPGESRSLLLACSLKPLTPGRWTLRILLQGGQGLLTRPLELVLQIR